MAALRAIRAAPQIAVIGGSSAPPGVRREAEAVGRELARAGASLVCGGLSGVMAAACQGAFAVGGLTIGLLPGTDRRAGNRWLRVAIPTGLGHFRNFLVVQAADGVIALPGASGTLSEAAMAVTLGKPVVAVSATARERSIAGTRTVGSAAEAVRLVLELAGTPGDAPEGAGEA